MNNSEKVSKAFYVIRNKNTNEYEGFDQERHESLFVSGIHRAFFYNDLEEAVLQKEYLSHKDYYDVEEDDLEILKTNFNTPDTNRWEVYEEANEKWDTERQIAMAAGEIGELFDELFGKRAQGRMNREAMLEELADAQIMLEQLQVLFGREEVEEVKQEKVRVLQSKVEND